MKNREVVKKYQGLSALSGRKLPSATAVNKVATLLRHRFSPAYEAIELARKMVLKDFPLPDGVDQEALPVGVAEARSIAVDELMNESQPIKKIPSHLLLGPEDMPKELKGDDKRDAPNDAGLAAILEMLGALYKPGDSNEESADLPEDERGELEPGEVEIKLVRPGQRGEPALARLAEDEVGDEADLEAVET